MKKALWGFLFAALMSNQALADDVFIDVSGAGTQAPGSAGTATDANTFTSIFDQMQIYAETTTVQYNTNLGGPPGLSIGDRFIDSGTAIITDLLPPLGDDEGISLISEITIEWSGLSGITTSNLTPIVPGGDLVQTIKYDPGTVFNFYFHGDATGPNADFGPTVASSDNTGFTDGEKVLEITLKGGNGTNTFSPAGSFLSGSSVLIGEITYALNDFWWFDNGDNTPGTAGDKEFEDLLTSPVPVVIRSKIDQNTDRVEVDFSNAGNPGPAGFGNVLFAVNSNHDGSIALAIPGPQTLMLFVMGLMMLVTFRRRFRN